MRSGCINIVLLIGLLFHAVCAVGQVPVSGISYRDSLYQQIRDEGYATLSCRFVYEQGRSEIKPALAENDHELFHLDTFIRLALNHPDLFIRRIRLSGYSSIEGSYIVNERLAYNRIEKLRNYLYMHYPALYAYPLDMDWTPEDWKELSRLAKLYQISEYEEVLDIIRRVPGFDTREELLRKLNGGRAYREMEYAIFPHLRRVEISFEFGASPLATSASVKRISPDVTSDTLTVVTDDSLIYNILEKDDPKFADSQSLSDASTEQTKRVVHRTNHICSFTTWAVKTNISQWAGIMPDFKQTTFLPNLSLEYYITERLSVEAGAFYSYWHYSGDKEFQGLSGYRIEPRYWLGLPSGDFDIFLGPYVRFGDYDMQRLRGGEVTTNYTGDYWDAGISAGLSFRLVGNWGLEVGARAGYVDTKAILYMPENGKKWFDSRKSYNKCKVTDLNVSLVYRFR